MDELPAELCAHIFSFLDAFPDQQSASQVLKTHKQVV